MSTHSLVVQNKKFELMLTRRAKAYSSSCPQAVTHRSTNRARCRVTSFHPKCVTHYATPPKPVPWRHLVNDFVSQPEIARTIHKKFLFWRSRSSKVIEFGTNRKPIYDFLLVINTNLGLYWDVEIPLLRYSKLLAENRKFWPPPSHLGPSFGVTPFEFMEKLYSSWN